MAAPASADPVTAISPPDAWLPCGEPEGGASPPTLRRRRVDSWRGSEGERRIRRLLARWLETGWARALLITSGTGLIALGVNLFQVPFRIVDGGVSGVGVLLLHTLGVPVSVTIVALNVPILALGLRAHGYRFIARTFLGIATLAGWVQLTAGLPTVTGDPLLATLYAGLLSGLGSGLVLRAGGSTGGSDTLARSLQRWFPWPVGTTVLWIDVVIIGSAGLLFGAERALYGAISLFVATRVIDFLLQGARSAMAAWIVTDRAEVIAQAVLEKLERGVTRVEVEGAFTGRSHALLYVVVGREEVAELRLLVRQLDPGAFMALGEVSEVLGEGFRQGLP
ncbi:MAG: YitT family protein [Bacillota bacterium]|nr:YitT family protein [Bacillota bacterium]